MHYRDVLKTCAGILNDRNQKYGDSDVCFGRISKIASVVLDKPVSEYDVAIILSCVKLGRIPGNPAYADNYVDLANYAAFSAHFADKTSATENVVKPSFSRSLADEHFTIKVPVMRDGEYRNRPSRIDSGQFSAALDTVEEDVVEKKAAE